ncbi:hypothetical protein BH10ACI1_BH10ACI1_09220 [soil metagenome]
MKKLNIIPILIVFFSICFAANTQTFAQGEVMTNNEVISLVKAGLSKQIIVNKIRTSKTDFDLSTNSLIKLKQAGVDDEIVNAMLESKSGRTMTTTTTNSSNVSNNDPNDPMSPHNIGIYYYVEKDGQRKMFEMEPNVVTQTRAGGMFGSAMTYGIMKVKVKAKVPGISANMQISETNPVFYFYLNENDNSMRAVKAFPANINQFQLIKFHVKDKGREVTVGKANAFGGKFGISDEYLVEFSFEKIKDGVFKVTPKTTLANGEYGFYLIGTGEGTGATFFDFGVKLVP